MRINNIAIRNFPPIQNFSVNDLGDFVVIAGRNGAGKTRLVQQIIHKFRNITQPNVELGIQLTSADELEHFPALKDGRLRAARKIETSDRSMHGPLQQMLQKSRRRQNFNSSLVVYDSDRKVQNVANLQFAFEFPDPFTENVGWDIGFQGLGNRWADTQHAIFKKIHRQTSSIANRARQLRADGKKEMGLEFDDPLDPFREIFFQLLGPKKLARADLQRQQILVEFEGSEFPITQLSSGEREVLSISFDLLLRKPHDCVIIFDEPELHLHPELLGRLINTLQGIGERNQFIFVTHSPEIISAANPESVVFLRPPENGQNQAVKLSEEGEATDALHQLGQSLGIISLGKKIVLIEGNDASADRMTYLAVAGSNYPSLAMLPAEGKGRIRSFSDIKANVLDRSLWGIQFFMITDGDCGYDAVDDPSFAKLPRYHIENYFLDSDLIAGVFRELDGETAWLTQPHQVEGRLVELARECLPYAVALRTSAQLRLSAGSVGLMPKALDGLDQESLVAKFIEKSHEESMRVQQVLSQDAVRATVEANFLLLQDAIEDGEKWKYLFPAKRVIRKFCSAAGIQVDRFQRLYIKAEEATGSKAFDEIRDILKRFADA